MRNSGQSSVVPIGGAPFVRPYTTHVRPIDTGVGSVGASSSLDSFNSNGSSPTFQGSPSSSSYSYSPNLGRTHVPLPDMPVSPTSSNGSSSTNNLQFEAALRYSSALHEHTRRMWESERANIERSKLGLSVNDQPSSKHKQGASSISNSSNSSSTTDERSNLPNRRGSLGSGLGVDSFWNRKKKHTKNSASIY